MSPLLELEGVRVMRGGRTVLEIERLSLVAGEVLGVSGENGAGKSTLLLSAAGLLDLAAGEVRLAGARFHRGLSPAPTLLRRKLGLGLQEPYPFAGTVLQNAAFGLQARGVGRAEREKRARHALEALGLAGLEARRAQDLSGGERKLLSMAQLACLELRLVLLDEPSAGVDHERLDRLETWVRSLRDQGVAVVLASHDAKLVARLADRRLLLQAGRVAVSP